MLLSGAKTPGTHPNAELSTSYQSRAWSLSPKPASDAAITTTGEYRLKTAGTWGSWTSGAGTWGAASAIMVRGTSSGLYMFPASITVTIGGISFTFTVTTIANPSPITFLWADGQPVIAYSNSWADGQIYEYADMS